MLELLWNLSDSIEIQILEVTATLLTSISKHQSPMMLYKTKDSVIHVLQEMVQFIKSNNTNSQLINIFKTYFNETVATNLKNCVEYSELLNVKRLLHYIYEPVIQIEC